MRFSFAFFLFCFSLYFSCSANFEGGVEEAVSENTAENLRLESEGSRVLRANVDDLPLRDAPGLKSNKIAFVKEGARLEFLEERAGPNLQITIREIPYDADWYKVRTTDGKVGWVFRGSVRFDLLPQGDAARLSVNIGKVLDFEDYIQTELGERNQGDLAKAIEYMKQSFALDDTRTNDAAYGLIAEYLIPVTWSDFGKYEAEVSRYLYEGKPSNYVKQLESRGWQVRTDGEGGLFAQPDVQFILNHLGIFFSYDLSRYLVQMEVEQDRPASADAGLMISPQAAAERLLFWSQLAQEQEVRNNDFEYKGEFAAQKEWYFFVLFQGLDNTPPFSFTDPPVLNPEFRTAYQFLAGYGDMDIGEFAARYLQVLEASSGRMSPESRALVDRKEKELRVN